MVLALPRIGEDVRVLDLLDQVDAQIADLTTGHARAASELDLGDRSTLVELVVTNLFEVLRAEVIVEELVAVVVLAIPDVRIEEVEVGEERRDRQHDRDPAFRAPRDAFAQFCRTHLVHQEQRGRHRQDDAHALHEVLPVRLLEDNVLPEEVLIGSERREVGDRVQHGKQSHRARVYTRAGGLSAGERPAATPLGRALGKVPSKAHFCPNKLEPGNPLDYPARRSEPQNPGGVRGVGTVWPARSTRDSDYAQP